MNKIQKRDLLGFFCFLLILVAIFCIAVFVYPMCLTSEGYSGEHVGPSLKEIIKSMLLFIPIILSFGAATYFYYFVLSPVSPLFYKGTGQSPYPSILLCIIRHNTNESGFHIYTLRVLHSHRGYELYGR